MDNMRNRTAEEEDAWLEAQLAEAYALIGNAPAKTEPEVEQVSPAPQAEIYREPDEDYPEEEPKPRKKAKKEKKEKGLAGLVVILCLELAVLVGVVAYWMMMLG